MPSSCRRVGTRLRIGFTFAVSAVAPSVLAAEAAVPPPPVQLEEIVVTAEKLGRSLRETTSSVVVYTGEELEARSFDDLYDVVLRTPNVSQSFGEKGFSIRGIDQRFGAGAGLLVNTVVDGTYLPNNQSTFFGPYSAWDLGQVEILRGPQGTSQGRNSLGGAIVLNTADAELNEFSGKARASWGELNARQFAGAVNVPLLEDRLALRLAADHRQTDGWVRNVTRGEDYDRRDFTNARAKLRFRATERLEARYTLNYTDSTGGEDLVDGFAFPDARVNDADGPAREGSEHLIHTLQLDYELAAGWNLTSISSLYRHDYVRIEDLDDSPAPLSNLDRTQDDEALSQELRLAFDDGGRLRGVAGLFYYEATNEAFDVFSVPVVFLGIDPAVLAALEIAPTAPIFQNRTFTTDETNYAAFAELEYDLTERLTVVTGLRYDTEQRDFTVLTNTSTPVTLPFPLPPDELRDTDADYDAWLPKIAIRYRLNDAWTLGGTAARAYRAGGVGVAVVSGETNEYDPEEAWTYELSARGVLADSRVSVQANAFYTEWQDQQVQRTSDFGRANGVPLDTVPDNAGESELLGFEGSLDAQLTSELTVFGSVGWLRTEFVEYDVDTFELTGNEFPYGAEWNLTVGFDYTHPSGFTARADVAWTDDAFTSEQNDPTRVTFEPILDGAGNVVGQKEFCSASPCNDPVSRIQDRTIVNAKVGWQQPRWSAFLFARNLLDDDYRTQSNPLGADFVTGAPVQAVRTGEPRVVGVELNMNL